MVGQADLVEPRRQLERDAAQAVEAQAEVSAVAAREVHDDVAQDRDVRQLHLQEHLARALGAVLLEDPERETRAGASGPRWGGVWCPSRSRRYPCSPISTSIRRKSDRATRFLRRIWSSGAATTSRASVHSPAAISIASWSRALNSWRLSTGARRTLDTSSRIVSRSA